MLPPPVLPLTAVTLGSIAIGMFGYGIWPGVRAYFSARSSRSLSARFFAWIDTKRVSPALYRLGKGKLLDKLLAVSGLSRGWTVERVLIVKKLITIVAGIGALIIVSSDHVTLNARLFYALAILALGWYAPELYLRRRVVLRKKRLNKMLAYLIDLLRLQVGAGLNLESSLRGLARHIHGAWGNELAYFIFLVDAGVPFDDALRQLTARVDLEDFNRFDLAVRQAQTLGASLSDTLAIQAEMLRTRRRQKAEEQARLASVKIALPLVFFIFPALLIIYLAPAVLRIIQLF